LDVLSTLVPDLHEEGIFTAYGGGVHKGSVPARRPARVQ
jgi:hypothetical protein